MSETDYFHRNYGWITDTDADADGLADNVNIIAADEMINLSPNPITNVGSIGLNHIEYSAPNINILGGTAGTGTTNTPKLGLNKSLLADRSTDTGQKILVVSDTNNEVAYIPVPSVAPTIFYYADTYTCYINHGGFTFDKPMLMDAYRIGKICTVKFRAVGDGYYTIDNTVNGPLRIGISGIYGSPVDPVLNRYFAPKDITGDGGSAGSAVMMTITNPSIVRAHYYLQIHAFDFNTPYRNVNAQMYKSVGSTFTNAISLTASEIIYFDDMCITYTAEYD